MQDHGVVACLHALNLSAEYGCCKFRRGRAAAQTALLEADGGTCMNARIYSLPLSLYNSLQLLLVKHAFMPTGWSWRFASLALNHGSWQFAVIKNHLAITAKAYQTVVSPAKYSLLLCAMNHHHLRSIHIYKSVILQISLLLIQHLCGIGLSSSNRIEGCSSCRRVAAIAHPIQYSQKHSNNDA